jgi:hypothetical protein
VALVVVHGIGAQPRGATLVEWVEPLLQRIDWLSRTTGGEGVVFEGVELSEGARDMVQARADYRDSDGTRREVLLRVTEAHWAQSFLAMRPGEVFTWGGMFVWRAFLRLAVHFSRILWLDPWWRVLSAPVIAALWAVGLVAAVAVSLLLPLLAVALVVPLLSSLVRAATGRLAEFVGDVAVWTRRPVRAAAMRAVVRAEIVDATARLAELAESEGIDPAQTRVVVLAYSQGATISAQTLFDPGTGEPRPPVDVFLTLGATLTLLGSPRWTTGRFAALRTALARETRRAADFNPVEEWSRLLTPPRWLNFWAIWDPFTAGPISTSMRARDERWRDSFGRRAEPTRGPEEHPLHNTANPLTDHQSYVGNVAEVVDPVARLLLGMEGRMPVAAHARSVRQAGLNRVLVVALAVGAVLAGWPWFVALGGAVVLLWANGALWRAFLQRSSWDESGRPTPRTWLVGYLLRILLVISGALLVVGPLWSVVTALAGVLAVVAPALGRLPRVLPERR